MPRRKHALVIRDDRAALQPGSFWWAYCRVSPGDKQDLASQRRAVQEFADKHQVVIARWWQDDGISGSSTEGRDGFDEMVHLARRDPGQVAGILLWNLARWARNDLESQYYRADLRLHGYAVVSVADDIPGGDMSLLVEAFIDLKNRKFLEDLSKDTRRGLRDTVLREVTVDGKLYKGFSGGGFPPRGYKAEHIETGRRKDGKPRINAVWVFDPEWQERVARARQMFAAGEPVQKIHNECKLFKVLSCYKTFWPNITYAGARRCGDTLVPNAHPAYDNREQRALIEARIAEHDGRGGTRPRTKVVHMLSGIAYCGECGGQLHGRVHPKGDYYYCARSQRRGSPCKARRITSYSLDSTVIEVLKEQILTEATIEEWVDAINEERRGDGKAFDRERAHIDREQKKLRRELANLVDYIASGNSSSTVQAAIREKEKLLATHDARLRLLTVEQASVATINITRQQIARVVSELHAKLNSEQRDDVWKIARAYIRRVDVWPDRIAVTPTLGLDDNAFVGTPSRLRTIPLLALMARRQRPRATVAV